MPVISNSSCKKLRADITLKHNWKYICLSGYLAAAQISWQAVGGIYKVGSRGFHRRWHSESNGIKYYTGEARTSLWWRWTRFRSYKTLKTCLAGWPNHFSFDYWPLEESKLTKPPNYVAVAGRMRTIQTGLPMPCEQRVWKSLHMVFAPNLLIHTGNVHMNDSEREIPSGSGFSSFGLDETVN